MYKLLPPARQNKILILFALLRGRQKSSELPEMLDIPKRTFSRYVQGLNEDVSNYCHIENFLMKTDEGECYVNGKYQRKRALIFHQLKLYYLKETIGFKLLKEIVTKGIVNSIGATNELLISESYLARTIGTLNKELADFEIKIKKKNNKLYLVGDEEIVRCFSFSFLLNSFQTLEWPFTQYSEQTLESKLTPQARKKCCMSSKAKKRQLLLFLAVIFTRAKSGFCIKEYTAEQLSLLELMENSFDISSLFLPEEIQEFSFVTEKNEMHFFNLFTRVLLPSFINDKQRILMGQIFSDEQHPSIDFARHTIKELRNVNGITIPSDQSYLLRYYITLFHFIYANIGDTLYYCLNMGPSIPEPEQPYEAEKIKATKEALKDSVKLEENLNISNSKHFVEILAKHIIQLSRLFNKPKILIYFHISTNTIAETYVKERLRRFFNENVLDFTEDYQKSDIVISDILESDDTKKRRCIFDSWSNSTQWSELLTMIRDEYVEKLCEEY